MGFDPAAFDVLLMIITLAGLLMSGFPVAFTLAGTAGAFALIGAVFGLFDLSDLNAFPQRIFGIMTNKVLVAVPLFVFMGVMLERARIAEDLLITMGRAFRGLPGGLAVSVLLVGALLAASTGIVGATVVTMGLLSLPAMLKHDYAPELASGTIAASGTLGQIIPPSIVLILLGDQLSSAWLAAQLKRGNFAPEPVSVNDLFAGALIPGLLLVGLYLVYVIGYALLYPDRAPAIAPRATAQTVDDGADEQIVTGRFDWREFFTTLIAPLLLIIAVLGSILGGFASPTEAASVGAVGAIMLAGYRVAPGRGLIIIVAVVAMVAMLALARLPADVGTGDISAIAAGQIWTVLLAWGLFGVAAAGVLTALWRTYHARGDDGVGILASVARSTLKISSMVFVILIGATMFSLVFRGFGGDVMIEHFLTNLPGGAFGAILIVMLVMFVLGFFLDFLEIIFIVVPIVGPALLVMDLAPGLPMSPVWLGIMMAVNLQTSFLTPPFGFALFYLRGVAPDSVSTRAIYRGAFPFVGIQMLGLVCLWLFPELATWLPQQIAAWSGN